MSQGVKIAFSSEVAGTWILILCWRLIYLPTLTLFDLNGCSLFIFFVTWFRARTQVR
ncbi:hypothetical protein MtrunA17_Chr2g0333141 [Medicago truncatula]|uniref:Uncharacterized protein n=1 Tax=Medicago truncatula TaxID=3880 RepID=A0A396JE97_MEDTR|nr:hypothetical protein MtrunA17_Chr2g0333141 [Medicago truncatula]